MPRYRVSIEFVGSTAVVVDAEDDMEAIEKALDQAPQNDFGFAEWDPGEWDVVEFDGVPEVEEVK